MVGRATSFAISLGVGVLCWVLLDLAYWFLGVATGLYDMCPQAPDWWIALYCKIFPIKHYIVAPGIGLFVALRIFRRCRARRTG